MFFVAKRATLLVPSGPSDHLHIILNDPFGKAEEVLMVSVRSVTPPLPYDDSCVLYKGDHDFLKHKSWVDYSRLLLEPKEVIAKAVKAGIFVPKSVCSTEMHARICYGLEKSPMVAPKYRTFYQAVVEDREKQKEKDKTK